MWKLMPIGSSTSTRGSSTCRPRSSSPALVVSRPKLAYLKYASAPKFTTQLTSTACQRARNRAGEKADQVVREREREEKDDVVGLDVAVEEVRGRRQGKEQPPSTEEPVRARPRRRRRRRSRPCGRAPLSFRRRSADRGPGGSARRWSCPHAAFPAGVRCTPSSVKWGELRSDEPREASSMSIDARRAAVRDPTDDAGDQLDLGADRGALATVDGGPPPRGSAGRSSPRARPR